MNFKKKIFVLFLSLIFCGILNAQKKSIKPEDYDAWKYLSSKDISNDGAYLFYKIKPQKGDGTLYIQDIVNSKSKVIERGNGFRFFANDKYGYYSVVPYVDSVRYAKFNKKKEPKKINYIINLSTMTSTEINSKYTSLIRHPKEPLIFFLKDIEHPKDTILDKKKKNLKKGNEKLEKPKNSTIVRNSRKSTKPSRPSRNLKAKPKSSKSKIKNLVIRNLETNNDIIIDSVTSYSINRGDKFNTVVFKRVVDSMKTLWAYRNGVKRLLYKTKEGVIGKIAFDKQDKNILFFASQDTSKIKISDLYLVNLKKLFSKRYNPKENGPLNLGINESKNMPKGYCLNGDASFSKNGKEIHFIYAKRPKEKVKDSLLKSEKFSLDIWSSNDTINMASQLRGKGKATKFTAIYYLKTKNWIKITDELIPRVNFHYNDNIDLALVSTSWPYMRASDWNLPLPKDYYLLDKTTGKRKLILKNFNGIADFSSPNGRFIIYFDATKEKAYSLDIKNNITREIAQGIDIVEKNDMPMYNSIYGFIGWNKKYDRLYVYDKYDIWSVDPTNKVAPICITKSWGRKNNTVLRVKNLIHKEDLDKYVYDFSKPQILFSFNELSKKSGIMQYALGMDEPKELIAEGNYIYKIGSYSKDADKCIWTRESFNEAPELWISDKSFANKKKLTNLSSQINKYKWGSVELIHWVDFNGKNSTGLLYKPENYDASKKYPTIVYFYEKSSQDKNKFHMPQPSWSIIIPSVCVSNDYVVFIPDITYRDGFPGESCYDKIVSGTQALIERGIADPKHIGLQGQSWGGYQIAYLVTRTNMYACASPGAPVSNMTSAYTGIRGNGMVRMFQYEHTQSRIGGTLWDKPMRYIENSPIFYVPKINTPLLIRHDDADEAVPYAQGVDFFMALRRCGKTAWLLNYNREPHNLRSRPARMDWTRRMHGFFDYYLKDKAMPRWMKEGISHVEKGKDQKYDLVK